MARGGGVRGEKRCEAREKWEMKRKRKRNTLNEQKKKKKKKGKKWEMKIWGKIFAGRKKNLGGRACPIEFFIFL